VSDEDNKIPPFHGRRLELGPRNPAMEAWYDDDGSLSIGNVQYGRMVDGVWLDRQMVERLKLLFR